jgi:hypothetical protein
MHERPQCSDQLTPVIGLAEKKSPVGHIFIPHPCVPGRQQKLYGWPAVPDCVCEPQAIHASGKVDVRKYNPDIVSSFKQSDCFIGTAGLKRVEPCFLQKGHCMHSQQELIFDNKNQWKDMGTTESVLHSKSVPREGLVRRTWLPLTRSEAIRTGSINYLLEKMQKWSSLGLAWPRAAPHGSLSFFRGRCPALGVRHRGIWSIARAVPRPSTRRQQKKLLGLGRPEARSRSGRCVRWAWPRFNFLPWAGVGGQHPHMEKKSAPKKATPVKLTAAMKRAPARPGDRGCTGAVSRERLAERIYRAMAAAQKR